MNIIRVLFLMLVAMVFAPCMFPETSCVGQDEKRPLRSWTIAEEIQFRVFSDSTGQHKTEAKFVQLANGTVELQGSDGEEISLPLEKLSKEDQVYVDERVKATSDDGVKEIRAQYIGIKAKKIELLTEAGITIFTTPNSLSAKDRAYIKFLNRKTILDVNVDGFLDAIEKTETFVEDLQRQKTTGEDAQDGFKKFKKTLARTAQKNAFFVCYLAANKIDFGLKPDSDFRSLMREYPDFWLAWRVFIVSELINSGGRQAIAGLKRYQDALIDEFEVRQPGADNSDIGTELEWVNDTAQQFLSLQNGSASNLQKISENAFAFDIASKIRLSGEIREQTKDDRASLDASNEEIRARQQEKLTEKAKSEFGKMHSLLKDQSDKLREAFDLASAQVAGLEQPLQQSYRALVAINSQISSVRSQISSVQNSINSCQSDIDSERREECPDQNRIDNLNQQISNYTQQISSYNNRLSQLSIQFSGLQQTYFGILAQYKRWYFELQRAYYRICELTNFARNKGRLFTVQYGEAINSDSDLKQEVDALEKQVGFWISRLPKMPVFISDKQIDEHEIRKEEMRVAKDVLITLEDLKEGLIELSRKMN